MSIPSESGVGLEDERVWVGLRESEFYTTFRVEFGWDGMGWDGGVRGGVGRGVDLSRILDSGFFGWVGG